MKKGNPEKNLEEEQKKDKSRLQEFVEAIIVAFILALIIRFFIIQAFKIPSGSMKNTLLIGDHILVNKFIFGIPIPFTDKKILPLRKPRRGDIVVFKFPYEPKKDYIKRVIGLPGEKIEIINKTVYVNGEPLIENYVQHTDPYTISGLIQPRDYFGPIIVKENHLFVLGDNRDQSQDSRYWGQLDQKYLKGTAFIIYFSWDSEKKGLFTFLDNIPILKWLPNGGIRWERIGKIIR